jgi:hypothetical protein
MTATASQRRSGERCFRRERGTGHRNSTAPGCLLPSWFHANSRSAIGTALSGDCSPASVWVKASRLQPLVPRDSKRFVDPYRGRGAVERTFGRLKNEYGLEPVRVRGIERVALHAA